MDAQGIAPRPGRATGRLSLRKRRPKMSAETARIVSSWNCWYATTSIMLMAVCLAMNMAKNRDAALGESTAQRPTRISVARNAAAWIRRPAPPISTVLDIQVLWK